LNRKKELLTPFGKRQLDISLRLIYDSQPFMIIVVNSLASKILIKHFPLQCDDNWGCHFATISSRKVPVFCSRPLSGPGVIDKFSRERLEWHIKKVAENFPNGSIF
jgi:hypothetical protein